MVYVLILLAASCRLLPHPWNFTPVLAVGLFGGAALPRRIAWLVPVAALLLSDLALGYAFGWMNLVTYGCFGGSVLLGRWLSHGRTWPRTGLAALVGSTLFYVVSNFAVWASGALYAHTGAGLVQCYVMAIPFFGNQVVGDLFWTAALFGVYDLAAARAKTRACQAPQIV